MSDIDKAWQEFVNTQNEDDWSIWRRDIPDGESGARLLELVFKAGAQHQAAQHTKELLQTKPTKQSMEAMRDYLLSIGVPHDDELNPVFVKFFNQGWIHCSTVADMVAEEKYAAQSKELAEALREVKTQRLSELYLANFPYEDWPEGMDGIMRVGDWVELNWQDHNGYDHTDGYGRIELHHQTDIPVVVMIEGFEDNGEPHGTYASLCFHSWNTMRPVSETKARAALAAFDGGE